MKQESRGESRDHMMSSQLCLTFSWVHSPAAFFCPQGRESGGGIYWQFRNCSSPLLRGWVGAEIPSKLCLPSSVPWYKAVLGTFPKSCARKTHLFLIHVRCSICYRLPWPHLIHSEYLWNPYHRTQVLPCPLAAYILCVCLVAQSRPTLCDSINYNLSGSLVHGILQTRILA